MAGRNAPTAQMQLHVDCRARAWQAPRRVVDFSSAQCVKYAARLANKAAVPREAVAAAAAMADAIGALVSASYLRHGRRRCDRPHRPVTQSRSGERLGCGARLRGAGGVALQHRGVVRSSCSQVATPVSINACGPGAPAYNFYCQVGLTTQLCLDDRSGRGAVPRRENNCAKYGRVPGPWAGTRRDFRGIRCGNGFVTFTMPSTR